MAMDPELPDLDDRLAEPETRYEVLDGELIYVSPADLLHGTQHVKIAVLIAAHVRAEFRVAADMLTRTSLVNDVAPDVSVLPRAMHPVTGKRRLEHLSFELVSTQTMKNAGRKAATLVERGVRRMFAINIRRQRVLEWSASSAGWQLLDPDGQIVDPVFAVPLSIASLLSTAAYDDELVDVLVRKRNPTLRSIVHKAARQAKARAKAQDVLTVLGARGVVVRAGDRKRILAERNARRLERWLAAAATCTRVAEVLTTP